VPPCVQLFAMNTVFLGTVQGGRNTIGGPWSAFSNQVAAVCPDELSFLMTEEGGELGRRE